MFIKTNARSPNGKKMSISRHVWNTVQKHFNTVQQAINDGKDLQLELIGAKHLIVSKFDVNGLWYIGIHDLTPSGTIIPMSGMNFTEEEWNKLVGYQTEIDSLLQGATSIPSGIKRDHTGQEKVRDIMMYRWSWLVGKRKVSESDVCFFNEEDCREDAGSHKPEKDKTNLVVETVWGAPPAKHVHLFVVFMFIFKKLLNMRVKEKCSGCINEKGSQSDHMGEGGCLSDMDKDDLEKSYQDVADLVRLEDLVTMFTKSRREIGASTSFAEMYAETTEFYMTPEGLLYFMRNVNPAHRSIIKLLEHCDAN